MKELGKRAVEGLGNSLLQYYGLLPWLRRRMLDLLSPSLKREFRSVTDFWSAILADEVSSGDRIRFRDVFITEWVPRQPGAPWVLPEDRDDDLYGIFSSRKRMRECQGYTYGEFDKSTDLPPGGVVRYPVTSRSEGCTCLSVVSEDAWLCDFGIPLVVSQPVYDAFRHTCGPKHIVEADIEAVLQMESPLLEALVELKDLSSGLNESFMKAIKRYPGVPFCNLYIDSRLDTTFRFHDTHPFGYLWAIQRVCRDGYTLGYIGNDGKPRVDLIRHDPQWSYNFEIGCVDLMDREQIENFVGIAKARGWSFSSGFPPRPEREQGIRDVEVLTNFDAKFHHFPHALSLAHDSAESKRDKLRIIDLVRDLERRYSNG